MFRNQSKQFDWQMFWKQFDWQMFWIRQVLFLAVPLLIALFTLHHETSIALPRVGIVLTVQLSLTVLNVAWAFHERNIKGRAAKMDRVWGMPYDIHSRTDRGNRGQLTKG